MAADYYEKITQAQALISQFRALHAAQPHDQAPLLALYDQIIALAKPTLVRQARRLAATFGLDFEELLDELLSRLGLDLSKPNFPSLETAFGAYLKTTPLRVAETLCKQRGKDVLSLATPLESGSGESTTLESLLADPKASEAPLLSEIISDLQPIIAKLPAIERNVLRLRIEGLSNREIAIRFDLSEATATRIYQRAQSQIQLLITTFRQEEN